MLQCVHRYIEDLQQSCVGRETKMNSLKRVLPPKMHKDKDIDGLIATEYTRICGLTLRDAKHLCVKAFPNGCLTSLAPCALFHAAGPFALLCL